MSISYSSAVIQEERNMYVDTYAHNRDVLLSNIPGSPDTPRTKERRASMFKMIGKSAIISPMKRLLISPKSKSKPDRDSALGTTWSISSIDGMLSSSESPTMSRKHIMTRPPLINLTTNGTDMRNDDESNRVKNLLSRIEELEQTVSNFTANSTPTSQLTEACAMSFSDSNTNTSTISGYTPAGITYNPHEGGGISTTTSTYNKRNSLLNLKSAHIIGNASFNSGSTTTSKGDRFSKLQGIDSISMVSPNKKSFKNRIISPKKALRLISSNERDISHPSPGNKSSATSNNAGNSSIGHIPKIKSFSPRSSKKSQTASTSVDPNDILGVLSAAAAKLQKLNINEDNNDLSQSSSNTDRVMRSLNESDVDYSRHVFSEPYLNMRDSGRGKNACDSHFRKSNASLREGGHKKKQRNIHPKSRTGSQRLEIDVGLDDKKKSLVETTGNSNFIDRENGTENFQKDYADGETHRSHQNELNVIEEEEVLLDIETKSSVMTESKRRRHALSDNLSLNSMENEKRDKPRDNPSRNERYRDATYKKYDRYRDGAEVEIIGVTVPQQTGTPKKSNYGLGCCDNGSSNNDSNDNNSHSQALRDLGYGGGSQSFDTLDDTLATLEERTYEGTLGSRTTLSFDTIATSFSDDLTEFYLQKHPVTAAEKLDQVLDRLNENIDKVFVCGGDTGRNRRYDHRYGDL